MDLAEYEEDEKEQRRLLDRAFSSPDPEARATAALFLAYLEPDEDRVLDLLRQAIRAQNTEICALAAYELAQLYLDWVPDRARDAVGYAMKAELSSDPEIREHAAQLQAEAERKLAAEAGD